MLVTTWRGLGASAPALMTTLPTTSTTPPAPGTCSADGQFIYADGFWRRLKVGESCASVGTQTVEVRTHVQDVLTYPMLFDRYKATIVPFLNRITSINQNVANQAIPCSQALNMTLPVGASLDFSTNPRPTGASAWAYSFWNPLDRLKWEGLLTWDLDKLYYHNAALAQRSLLPFSFYVFGELFSLGELGDSLAFQRDVTPSDEQRFLIEFQAVLYSMKRLQDTIIAMGTGAATFLRSPVTQARDYLRTNQKLSLYPKIEGMSFQAPPTIEGETLQEYLGRGGFLIDYDTLVSGSRHIGYAQVFTRSNGDGLCGLFCKDPSSGLPYCSAATLPEGIDGWEIFAKINGEGLTLTGKPWAKDVSAFQKVIGYVAKNMKKVLETLCQPANNAYAQASIQIVKNEAQSNIGSAQNRLATATTAEDKYKADQDVKTWMQYAKAINIYAAAAQPVLELCGQAMTPPLTIQPEEQTLPSLTVTVPKWPIFVGVGIMALSMPPVIAPMTP